jgi:DNA-binding transcriptional regulator YhcF (GntR family)
MHLDKHHPRPVYLQLKELLQGQIEQGLFFPHQKLPSERELCRQHNLSRMTARKALQTLIVEGFAYTRVGKGTFVSDVAGVRSNVSGDNGHSPASLDIIAESNNQQQLIDQLLAFDSIGAEQTIRSILANHSLETVAVRLFPQVIRQLETHWHKGKANLLAQHYAITTLRSQLISMVNATNCECGAKALLSCAPGDQHEIGLLLLALSLRRRGYAVIYLGPNMTTTEFEEVVNTIEPQLICFSAATVQSAEALGWFSGKLQTKINGTSLTFGGTAFNQRPDLIPKISGLYLGDTIEHAIEKIQELAI